MKKKSRRSPVAAFVGGGLAVVDRVRGADDQRARGLAEDLGQAHDRDATGLDEVVEHAPGADRARAGRRRRRAGRACAARRRRAAPRPGGRRASRPRRRPAGRRRGSGRSGPRSEALAGRVLEQAVDRRRLRAGGLGQPPRGLAGRRAQPDACAARAAQDVDERAHRRGLAGARAAGEDREPVVEHGAHDRPLGVGGDEAVARAARGDVEASGGPSSISARTCSRQAALDASIPGSSTRSPSSDEPAARGERVDAVLGVGAEQAPRALGQLGAGEVAVAVVLGLAQGVAQARVEPPGASGGVPSACASASAVREADAVELGQRRRGPRAAARSRRARGAVDPRGDGRRHAVLVQEQPHRAQRALRPPTSAPRRRCASGRCPGTSRSARRDRGRRRQHLLGPVALEQPRRAARADVLDRAQVGQQRVLAGGLLHPDCARATKRQPCLGCARQAPSTSTDSPSWTWSSAPGDHDLLAVVADRREHGERAVVRPPAHRGHLDAEGAIGRGRTASTRPKVALRQAGPSRGAAQAHAACDGQARTSEAPSSATGTASVAPGRTLRERRRRRWPTVASPATRSQSLDVGPRSGAGDAG